jgi:hydrogenase-4 component F
LLNHALAKSLAFFSAGNVQRRFATREIGEVRGLAKVQPVTAVAMLVAGLALVGMPPFSMFVSEVMVVSALATQSFASDTLHVGRFLTIIVADEVRSLSIVTVFLLFAVALFGGFTYRLAAMVWGTPPDGVKHGEAWDIGHVPLIVTGLALVGLGVALPDPMRALMDRAVAILMVR